MNELKLIKHIIPLLRQNSDTVVGPGDDCAVVRVGGELLLLAVDQVISGVHYLPSTPPEAVAAKLLKRNLSDIAAMGGTPFCALLTLAGNITADEWYHRFFAGLAASAAQFNVSVSGGDTAVLPAGCPPDSMVATLTITGKVEDTKICRRNYAQAGQLLFATGCFGRSFPTEHHLSFLPRLPEGVFVGGAFTNCMIDISDGLLLDASRIAEASGVGIVLDTDAIPRRDNSSLAEALGDGEDYELIFTVDPEKASALTANWPFDTPLTAIGKVTSAHSGLVFAENGVNLSATQQTGYEHSSE